MATTPYPTDLPLEQILAVIALVKSGNLKAASPALAKDIWLAAGYALGKSLGEPTDTTLLQPAPQAVEPTNDNCCGGFGPGCESVGASAPTFEETMADAEAFHHLQAAATAAGGEATPQGIIPWGTIAVYLVQLLVQFLMTHVPGPAPAPTPTPAPAAPEGEQNGTPDEAPKA